MSPASTSPKTFEIVVVVGVLMPTRISSEANQSYHVSWLQRNLTASTLYCGPRAAGTPTHVSACAAAAQSAVDRLTGTVNHKKRAYLFIVPSHEFITSTYSTQGLKGCEPLHTGAAIFAQNQAAGSGLAFCRVPIPPRGRQGHPRRACLRISALGWELPPRPGVRHGRCQTESGRQCRRCPLTRGLGSFNLSSRHGGQVAWKAVPDPYATSGVELRASRMTPPLGGPHVPPTSLATDRRSAFPTTSRSDMLHPALAITAVSTRGEQRSIGCERA